MSIEELKKPERIDEDRIEKLKEIFPEAFGDGKLNLEILKDEIMSYDSNVFDDESSEFYGIQWVGKKEARKLAYLPPTGTLKFMQGEGIDEDNTENVFIKGDNLEVIRILRKSYKEQIKMIYIDPPYNTGDDFIYKDNFKEPVESYLRRAGQADEEGLLTSNPKSSGRFHANWLSMIYPRLKVAKDLLSKDGVIFISIDDNEQANLKLLMDSVFGPDNFVAQMIWNTEGHTDNQYYVKVNHEYVLMYVKDRKYIKEAIGNVIDPNTRSESNLWKGYAENSITKNGPANPPSEVTLPVGFPCEIDDLILDESNLEEGFYNDVDDTGYITRDITKKYSVTYPIRKNKMMVSNGRLTIPCTVYSGWANANKLRKFIDNGCNPINDGEDTIRFYLSKNGVIYYIKERENARNILSVLRNMGTTEQMRSSLEAKSIRFDYPKPVKLIKYLMKIGSKKDSLILDFFAGSGTTATSAYELNREDEGNRKFILVQLEEPLEDGDFSNIADLTAERIRKDIAEIKAGFIESSNDLGFKVYKMEGSNFKKWEKVDIPNLNKVNTQLDIFSTSPFKGKPEVEDLITELMLIEGLPLNSAIYKENKNTNLVVTISHPNVVNKLVICLDEELEADTIEYLMSDKIESELHKTVLICLDSALSDNQKVILNENIKVKTI
jgi:adenine-specific DNA-methyltransferase